MGTDWNIAPAVTLYSLAGKSLFNSILSLLVCVPRVEVRQFKSEHVSKKPFRLYKPKFQY